MPTGGIQNKPDQLQIGQITKEMDTSQTPDSPVSKAKKETVLVPAVTPRLLNGHLRLATWMVVPEPTIHSDEILRRENISAEKEKEIVWVCPPLQPKKIMYGYFEPDEPSSAGGGG
ncbi:hypothetical protein H2199_005105 [Coniosporium tulheliwenetii]|uniref:Uncharacterized protein n=1 Tax=Coniosporium tulheliwenetii TaxID=3383036 RepID=A0ACC2Z3F0_9PEZI|nr:hypothetical protein H2199_005105 [Cladosporium sp. JES 115]